jgi:hypothetical protein
MTHGYKGVYKFRLNNMLDRLKEVRFYGQEDGLPSNMLNNVSKIKNSWCLLPKQVYTATIKPATTSCPIRA